MKYQNFLRLYKACLQLYPGRFRRRYAEQMYLTAEDILRDAQGVGRFTRAAQLAGDASLGLVREHSKQIGGAGMQKHSKTTWASAGMAVLIGLEIVAVPVLAFIGFEPFVSNWSTLRVQTSFGIIDSVTASLLPVILAALSFRLTGRLCLGLGHRLAGSLFTGCAAAYTFFWLDGVFYLSFCQKWPIILHGPFGVVYDFACVALSVAVFYVLGMKVTSRLATKPKYAK